MNCYTFPALLGNQGEYIYYLIQCKIRLLTRIFLFDEAEVPADLLRMQTVDQSIVTKYMDYLANRRGDYTLAPLVAVVDEVGTFEPLAPEMAEIGRLHVPMSARLIIRDGQHRRAALTALLKRSPALGDDTLAIMLLPDPALRRAASIYADLHPSPMAATRSKRVLHDHGELASLVRQLVNEVPLFQGFTELEKTTISNRSTAIFTLSAIYQATQALLNNGAKEIIRVEQAAIVREFWRILSTTIPQWQQAMRREMSAATLRQNYIHSHTVTLLAIGMAGHDLIAAHPDDWQERLKILGDVDWSRENRSLWEGRAMVRGKMNKSHDSIQLTAAAIKRLLGLKMTERELALEQALLDS
ncbi:DNA sulfur modification protein DndB [Candidatus Viridilinea mediisalina]|uniref:DNA sulfur modification protein DndB n=1 Tax=Candidatus Viridilinea mediisalina TaxID=2024553 RepID=UPI0013FE4E33|nr:DNA sulfur modification protein DndB [Candidatus Viridilinea mediisalina]